MEQDTGDSIGRIAEEAAGAGPTDLAHTLRGIAAAARQTLGADRASLYVVDLDTQNVADVYTTETDPRRRAFLRRSVGHGVTTLPIWRVHLASPDPLLAIEDIRDDPAIPPALADRLGSGALLGVRLEHESVVHAGSAALLGTLYCSYEGPRRFTEEDRRAARGLAGLATLTLANARLQAQTAQSFADARGLATEQAALRRVATRVAADAPPKEVFRQTAEEVAGLLGVELGLVARFENGRAVSVGYCGAPIEVAFPVDGAGALAQVARTGQVARIADYKALAGDHVGRLVESRGYRSGVATPVRVGGQLWGALLAATTRPAPIDAEAEARLERFAELVALAIANAEAQARLIIQAATDPLTGLANHRTFFERLDAEVRRARRRGDGLSLVMFDLDHFKRVNDLHGHLAGDGVLAETAMRLAALTRVEDVIARIGGEEFAWLLPDADARAAWLAGERGRRAIADTAFPGVGRLTVSAGVAELREGMSVIELFRRADAALYWAKDHGRDVCMLHAPEHDQALDARPATDAARLASGVGRLVALAQQQIGLTTTVLSEFRADRLIVRNVAGEVGAFGLEPGAEVPLDDRERARLVDGSLPYMIRDARRERAARALPLAQSADIGAYVGAPVTLPSGELYGTLSCLSRRAEPGLSAGDLRMLRIVAGILAEEIEVTDRAERVRDEKRDGLRRVLTGESLNIVLQPIVELDEGRVLAVEALSRFTAEPPRPPAAWFADAAAHGLSVELDLLAIRSALTQIDKVPAGARLSLNASPATLCTPQFLDALAGVPGDRFAIEITEHAPVEDYAQLRAALGTLRGRGVQLMVDDAGAGILKLPAHPRSSTRRH